MANYQTLKTAIQQVVKTNGNNEITGALLQQSLLAMINSLGDGYQFKGVATPTTNPGNPDAKVFYLTDAPGTYPNFSGIIIPNGKIGVLFYDSIWKANYIELPISVDDSPTTDLDISDENGNSIVRFKNGHIITEKFDSAKISDLTLKKFIGKKIGLIADSITTFSGWLPSDFSGYSGASYETYYPRGNVDSVTKTWWYKMAEMLGLNPATDISNCAWSGSRVSGDSSSTTNAAAGCSTRRITDLAMRGYNPDIIICFISCNDWGNTPNVPIGTWKVTDPIPAEGIIGTLREAYALMLYKIHSTYPNARVFCCTNMDDKARDRTEGWPPNNYDGISVYEWNQNIIEIAEAFGCDIINMHNCGINYANMANFVVDAGLHPNAIGMEKMAQKIVAELIAKY